MRAPMPEWVKNCQGLVVKTSLLSPVSTYFPGPIRRRLVLPPGRLERRALPASFQVIGVGKVWWLLKAQKLFGLDTMGVGFSILAPVRTLGAAVLISAFMLPGQGGLLHGEAQSEMSRPPAFDRPGL